MSLIVESTARRFKYLAADLDDAHAKLSRAVIAEDGLTFHLPEDDTKFLLASVNEATSVIRVLAGFLAEIAAAEAEAKR